MTLENPVQTSVILALGSNLGDRCANLNQALREISAQVAIAKTSSIYETSPWGYLEQPVFFNQVVSGSTLLDAHAMLTFVKEIEQKMGRVKNFLNGPRLIDIDILLLGDQTVKTDDLIIPHPRMLERGFVMLPLSEIEPDLMIPGTGKSVAELTKNVDLDGIHKIESDRKK